MLEQKRPRSRGHGLRSIKPISYRWALAVCAFPVFAALFTTTASGQRATIASPDTLPPPPVATWDSLYSGRDSAALVKSVRAWKGNKLPVVVLYQGIVADWTNNPNDAVGLLEPLVASSPPLLSRTRQREAMRALSSSYFKAKKYSKATDIFLAEIIGLDAVVDSAVRAEEERKALPAPILEALTSPEATPPPAPEKIPKELGFIALLFALFLLPKMLQRYRVPGAITALVMGAIASAMGWFPEDPTLNLLSTLGIVALFLFAGLEIDGREIRKNIRPLVLHATIWSALAIVTALVASMAFGLSPRVAALLALAIVTPSTGFILSSLSEFGLTPEEQRTVRTYAVGSELIALGAFFFVLQSTSLQHLGLGLAAMAGVVIIIPLAFKVFAAFVAPYAPKSEFAFLLMVAVVCAYATRLLGVYYLVGAFLVGVAAQRFRASHPAMSSEKMIDALESFGSVFIPFYFFHAGTDILPEHLTWNAVGLGLLLVAAFVPIRIGVIALHRRWALKEPFKASRRIGSALVPTLVFTLVIVSILHERFGISGTIAGGLVLYTVLNTIMPAFVLRAAPADFEDFEALPLRTPASAN